MRIADAEACGPTGAQDIPRKGDIGVMRSIGVVGSNGVHLAVGFNGIHWGPLGVRWGDGVPCVPMGFNGSNEVH